MIGHIIRKEILENLYSYKFILISLISLALIILSVYTGAENYVSLKKEYEIGVRLAKETLADNPNWQVASYSGYTVVRRPEPLGVVVTGIEGVMGKTAIIHIWAEPDIRYSKYTTNPLFAIFGDLDFTFIVKVVLSLFVILLAYDAICGEKERGTLKLMLSNSISRDKIILGKAAGELICIMVPLALSILLGFLLIILFYPHDIRLAGDDWARIGLIMLLFFLYIVFFFFLSLFVSSRTDRPAVSFLFLLFAWVLMVAIIPKASIVIAEQWAKVPSIHEINERKYQIHKEAWRNLSIEYHKRASSTSLSPVEMQRVFDDLRTEIFKQRDQKLYRIDEDYKNRLLQLTKMATNLSSISPTASLTYGAMELARTGLAHYEKYIQALRAYREVFLNFARQKELEEQKARVVSGQGPPGDLEAGKLDISQMPEFAFNKEPVSASLGRIYFNFILLSIPSGVLFLLTYISFLRYDPR